MQSSNAEISAAVALILADLDRDIAERRPVCRSSGRCCKFEEYGHRLYVTAVELIHFQHALPQPIENQKSKIENNVVSLPQFFAQEKPLGCPYQVDGLCTARDARPLGCRIYFCDEDAQDWQRSVYEKYHAQLQALHQRFDLPYRYIEWRTALREIMENPCG